MVSPLELMLDDEGEATLVACSDFADEADAASDEPRASSQFSRDAGRQTVENAVVIGGGSGFARGYLDQLAEETATNAGLHQLITLSTQAFAFFTNKTGFTEGTIDDLPADHAACTGGECDGAGHVQGGLDTDARDQGFAR